MSGQVKIQKKDATRLIPGNDTAAVRDGDGPDAEDPKTPQGFDLGDDLRPAGTSASISV